MPELSYEAAERYILSREFFGMKLGLENITEFLDSIGSPQTRYCTVHIAGTNGKGSTAAMLDAILRIEGYKTGLFTSPHLVSLRERIRVNGRMMPKRSVVSFVGRYRAELSRRKLSFFELIAAMALEHFCRTEVDIAVIETGLGGRLDATNVLNPILTITTDVSKDHVEILGSTLAKIAGEKAGIIKESVPHLVGLLPHVAEKVIRERCYQRGAPFHKLRRSSFVAHPKTMTLDFKWNGLAVKNLSPSLVGTCQLRNSALVMRAVSMLNDYGLSVSRKSVVKGITGSRWPGRFQVLDYKRKPTHVLDVSHNAAGIEAFVESFKVLFPARKAHIITGFVKRKEHQAIFNHLSSIAESYVLVPLNTRRSVDLDELIGNINWRGVPRKKFRSLKSAYTKLLRNSSADDIIVIIGSHFLVGEFFETFGLK